MADLFVKQQGIEASMPNYLPCNCKAMCGAWFECCIPDECCIPNNRHRCWGRTAH